MERLLEELTSTGVLDPAQVDWARADHAEHGGTLDTSLLSLDLIDEEGLLRGLRARFRRPTATAAVLSRIDPGVAKTLPVSFSKSFRMCPLSLENHKARALVECPLPEESVQELRELFGLEVEQLVAPSHYLAVARAKAYGTSLDARAEALEARLARRRSAPDLVHVAARMADAGTLASSIEALLDFASRFVEFACFLALRGERLGVVGRGESASLAAPDPGSTLRPAILHGGYFLGPPGDTEADRLFFRELGRDVPRTAFVAPVPISHGGPVVLYADNGPRGIASRWIAELTVLVGRLGHRRGDWASVTSTPATQATPTELEPASASPPAAEEQAALERLKAAAADSGITLTALVDELLTTRGRPTSNDQVALDLVGEMKGLFERLATDIPATMARGVETAFRDLAPRLAAGAPVPGESPRAPRRASDVEIVQTEARPREVGSYASKRRKVGRVKL